MFEIFFIIGVAAKKAENNFVAPLFTQCILTTSSYGWR